MEDCFKITGIRRKPLQPYGSRVYNADADLEDRKREADIASLTVSSLSTLGGEESTTMTQQQESAAPNNLDR